MYELVYGLKFPVKPETSNQRPETIFEVRCTIFEVRSNGGFQVITDENV